MNKVSLLLPAACIENIGITLEDFFREVVLAAKRVLNNNLYYRIYPLSAQEDDAPFVAGDSTEVARFTEHRLARYAVLPQEKTLIKLYRNLNYDLSRPSYPARFRAKSFWEYYLSGVGFPLLEQALDALFWVTARGTTKKFNAEQGIRLMKELFGRPGAQFTEDKIRLSQGTTNSPEATATETFEETLLFTTLPYPTDTTYLVVYDEEAPIEGRNTVLVKFHPASSEAPPKATLTVFLPFEEGEIIRASKAEKEALRSYLLRVMEERFDRRTLWKVEEKASRGQPAPAKEAQAQL